MCLLTICQGAKKAKGMGVYLHFFVEKRTGPTKPWTFVERPHDDPFVGAVKNYELCGQLFWNRRAHNDETDALLTEYNGMPEDVSKEVVQIHQDECVFDSYHRPDWWERHPYVSPDQRYKLWRHHGSAAEKCHSHLSLEDLQLYRDLYLGGLENAKPTIFWSHFLGYLGSLGAPTNVRIIFGTS